MNAQGWKAIRVPLVFFVVQLATVCLMGAYSINFYNRTGCTATVMLGRGGGNSTDLRIGPGGHKVYSHGLGIISYDVEIKKMELDKEIDKGLVYGTCTDYSGTGFIGKKRIDGNYAGNIGRALSVHAFDDKLTDDKKEKSSFIYRVADLGGAGEIKSESGWAWGSNYGAFECVSVARKK